MVVVTVEDTIRDNHARTKKKNVTSNENLKRNEEKLMFQKCTKKNKVLYLRVKSNKYKRKHKQEMGNV